MMSLVFVLLIGAAVATQEDRILGGYECQPYSQPYVVSLNIGYHWCGGSLVDENWVVSSAYCYKSLLEVRLGEHNLKVQEGTEQFIRSSLVIRHPDYNPKTLNNDIMLIKLSRPATLNHFVKTVALPTCCASAGTMCKVSGWTYTKTSTLDKNTLQCLDIPVLSDTYCYKRYYITNSMFCAGLPEGGKGPCKGDGGAPLVCNGVLQGFASWGYGCGLKNYPAVYTKVCLFQEWLKDTMAS